MKRAYKTEMLLSDEQADKINRTIGTYRYVYNLYLHTTQEHFKETKQHLSDYYFSKWLNNVHTKETDWWIKEYGYIPTNVVEKHEGIVIDLGISTFAVCSHNVEFNNINKTKK